MRDEFTPSTKRKLADRVAWKCSFPGCGRITIGPGHENSEQVINLGEAAHIHAASQNGPRPNPNLTSDKRKSIDNGIWMCRQHAKIIDSDFTNYSAATLKQWKLQAEERTYQNLKELKKPTNLPLTLVSIGRHIIFEGIWKSVKNNEWEFEIDQFIEGGIESIREFSTNNRGAENYIIVESQGDGRVIANSINWKLEDDTYIILVSVYEKQPRIDPNDIGEDIGLGEDGDLSFVNGDFNIVSGIECAKQLISTTLSLGFGELIYAPKMGSHFSEYFWAYKANSDLLNRLLKLEITRLVSIPTYAYDLRDTKPALNFINRIIDAEIKSTKLEKHRIPVRLKLEWGNGEIWEGLIKIYIHEVS
jgi:hypothetical protein